MADSNQGQLKIWGRANSVNVQKVLWCLRELDLAYERIDAGMAFGRNREPDYLAMNPNGRVPTLVDGDFVLWESNSVMRYLVLEYGQGSPLYPQAPKRRTSQAVAPIKASTTRKAMKNRAANGISEPNRVSNI